MSTPLDFFLDGGVLSTPLAFWGWWGIVDPIGVFGMGGGGVRQPGLPLGNPPTPVTPIFSKGGGNVPFWDSNRPLQGRLDPVWAIVVGGRVGRRSPKMRGTKGFVDDVGLQRLPAQVRVKRRRGDILSIFDPSPASCVATSCSRGKGGRRVSDTVRQEGVPFL